MKLFIYLFIWLKSFEFYKIIQIEDCRTRYNGDADHHQRRKKFTFPARLLSGDCFEVNTVIFF